MRIYRRVIVRANIPCLSFYFFWKTVYATEIYGFMQQLRNPHQVFGEYVPEIHFETQISEKEKRGYKDITEQNIEEIKYEI
ncbi:MAG: hypothetical protein ACUVXA_18595 [Candidatus Jordarchaeum sp.]|uniref:hypothetical protein n=1 Tax=Candidatus Jordarchaeum sp. TaxID=2823881 RepID=UPI004049DD4E